MGSQNSTFIASDDHTVRLWDIASHKPLGGPLTGHSGMVSSVAFSPDGKTLASASKDQTVRLWDVANRQPLGEPLKGHSEPVSSVAFSPDGKTLASGSLDKTVRLWDVSSQRPLGEPLIGDNTNGILSVAFSPDGKTLASGGTDAVQLWGVDPNSWAASACKRANRNLSQAEWEHYVGKNVPYHRTCSNLPDGEGVQANQQTTKERQQ
jgi:WD40 repeat protein